VFSRPLSARVVAVAALAFAACVTPYERGERLYRQGDPGGAIDQWQAVPESNADHRDARERLVLVQVELERALDRYEKRAEFFESQDRLAEAVLYYRLAVKFDPSRTQILDHVQIVYRQLHRREAEERAGLTEALRALDLRRAAQYAETLEKLNPFDPAIQIDVGQVRAEIGVEVSRHMLEGERAFAAGDRAAARRSFGEVLALEPDNEAARGYVKVMQDAQLSPWPRSTSRKAAAAVGHFDAAEAARERGEHFLALAEYEAALKENAKHAAARRRQAELRSEMKPRVDRLYREGKQYYEEEDLQNALLKWDQALLIDPEDTRTSESAERARRILIRLDELAGGP
jgi:tetratricopeptide (TPR) repeat protein